MARKSEIISLNLHETPEDKPEETNVEKAGELSAREQGAQLRQETAQKFHQSVERFGEVGHNLWSGMKRIGREGLESAKKGIKHGAEAGLDYSFYGAAKVGAGAKKVGRGIETGASVIANSPEWLGEKAYEGVETVQKAGRYSKEKVTEAAGYTAGKVKDGYDWTAGKMSDAKDWSKEQYGEMKDWAGEKADAIKGRAMAAKDKFVGKIESAKAWYQNWQGERDLRKKQERLKQLENSKSYIDQEISQLKAALGLEQKVEELSSAA
jgi:hypothetical protein